MPETKIAHSFATERQRQLAAAVPPTTAVLFLLTLVYALADVWPGDEPLASIVSYALALLLSAGAFAVFLLFRPRPDLLAIVTDLLLNVILAGKLATGAGTLSGGALILSLKLAATALLLPWAPLTQLISASFTVCMYLLVVWSWSGTQPMLVHQWLGPILAAVLSVVGAVMVDRNRRALFEKATTLSESETQLRSILRSSPDGIAVLQQGAITYANDRLAELLGCRDAAAMIGRRIADHAEAPDLSAIESFVTEAGASTARLGSFDTTLRRDDGSRLRVALTAAPFAYHGAPAVLTFVRDITRRALGMTLLEGERQALERIAAGTPIAEQLAALCHLFEELCPGSLCSTLLLDDSGERLHHGAAPSLPAAYTAAIDGTVIGPKVGSCGTAAFERRRVEVEDIATDPLWEDYRALAAEHHLAACWSTPILSSRAEVLGTFAVYYRQRHSMEPLEQWLVDRLSHLASIAIERSRLENAQREQAEVFAALARVGRELIATSSQPVLLERLCDLSAEMLQASLSNVFLRDPASGDFVPQAGGGKDPIDWDTLRLLRARPSDFEPVLSQLADDDLLTIETQEDASLLPRGFGRAFRVRSGMFVALRRGTEIIGALTIACRHKAHHWSESQKSTARGIAQLASLALENARLLDDLTRAAQVKSEFVATMSHELRTPLNVIIGYQDLLLDGAFGPLAAEQIDTLRRVARRSRELLDLVNATLDLSRLDAGRVPIERSQVDVQRLLRDLQSETAELATHHDVVFEWRAEPGLALDSDVGKLKVVLKSLIHNAMKFTPHGKISVSAAARDQGVEWVVSDTGIGISAAAQRAIFEPFTQADETISARFGGAGLGLYIVRRLVDLLGGVVSVESELGKGATFRVWLAASPSTHSVDGAQADVYYGEV